MGETCNVCGVAVSGASIMYTPDGNIVCPRCFGNVAIPTGARPPWKGFAIAGAVAGLIPFGVHVSSSSSSMVNGHVTSFVYRDWIAVACGVAAIILGAIATAAARKEQLQKALAFAAGIGVVLLGGAQIARGFGVFEDPGSSSAGSQTSMSFEAVPSSPVVTGDPKSPETCPDSESCFQLGLALDKANDEANATKAYERSCGMDAFGGCFNAGLNYLNRKPQELVKAEAMFAKACDHGDPQACTNLGRIYGTDGPIKDLVKAKAMFAKGCDGKLPEGCHYLALVFDQGLGGPQDEPKARALFEQACTGGTADSCFFLGNMRQKGLGGDVDKPGALAAYTDGCKLGNKDACDAVENASKAKPEKPAKKKGK